MPVSPFDNELALRQMSEGFAELGRRLPAAPLLPLRQVSKLLTLGGDHSIVMPALRALKEKYGHPIAVLHFDAHLDTWHPAKYPSKWIDDSQGTPQSYFNHGSMFWLAAQEGLIANGSAVHAGLRPRLSGEDWGDLEDDTMQGWKRISCDEIDEIGADGILAEILTRLGTEQPVYMSVDIDVLDPGNAPATGTPEPGGWSTRELIRILRGLENLNLVGADIVEVSPSYDGPGEITSLAAAQVGFEIITSMVKRGLKEEKLSTHSPKDEL
jgi:agmatinase